MSSTNRAQAEALACFFEKQMLPLRSRLDRAAPRPGFDPVPASAFLARRRNRLRKEDFEIPFGDESQIVASLERHWAGTPLEDLPRKLLSLARQFGGTEERAELSSFIYEMF
jgi:hypothetical protein